MTIIDIKKPIKNKNVLEKEAFVSELINTVKDLSIKDVISDYGVFFRKTGYDTYSCQSPFRYEPSRSISSFTISLKKNIFKDWKLEGYAGNSIKFVSLKEEVDFVHAAFILGVRYGIITEDEMNEYYHKKRYNSSFIKTMEVKFNKQEKPVEKVLASIEIRNKIYSIFISCCKLSDIHRNYLIQERKLNDGEIKFFNFFSMPTRAIMRNFIKELEKEGFKQEDLYGIPGFYRRKGDLNFTFRKYSGIGIPIVDEDNNISAIQIRNDEVKEGTSRYIWFSSSFAIDDEENEMGSSPGTPIDTVYPNENKTNSLMITEGKFKSIECSKTFNCVSFSVQGVGNWRGILEKIESIKNTKEIPLKRIYIMFDSDMCYNYGVSRQAKNMSDEIQKKYSDVEIFYGAWNIDDGKGIDDLLLSGKKETLRKYMKKDMDEVFFNIEKEITEKENKKPHELPMEEYREYFEKSIVGVKYV